MTSTWNRIGRRTSMLHTLIISSGFNDRVIQNFMTEVLQNGKGIVFTWKFSEIRVTGEDRSNLFPVLARPSGKGGDPMVSRNSYGKSLHAVIIFNSCLEFEQKFVHKFHYRNLKYHLRLFVNDVILGIDSTFVHICENLYNYPCRLKMGSTEFKRCETYVCYLLHTDIHYMEVSLIGFRNCQHGNWVSDAHYSDVIMTTKASQITSLTIVYSTVYSGIDQRKHQSSASLAFVREIHRGPVNSPHKWPVTRKMFPFDDVIMLSSPEVVIATTSNDTSDDKFGVMMTPGFQCYNESNALINMPSAEIPMVS